MRYWLLVTPIAQRHIRDIAAWYYTKVSDDVAADFLTAFQSTTALLRSMPFAHSVHPRFTTRHTHLHRFPYTVWYDIVERTILILALTHDRMSDETVKSRLTDE